MIDVFLDTNVLIEGSRAEAIVRIRELAAKGLIRVFTSPDSLAEQSARSRGTLRQRLSLCLVVSKEGPPAIRAAAHHAAREISKTIDSIETAEQAELDFWQPVRFYCAVSDLNRIILLTSALPADRLVAADRNGLLPLLQDLLLTFRLSKVDALLLLLAHDSGCTYFITSDQKGLINRALRVPWLLSIPISPKAFVGLPHIR